MGGDEAWGEKMIRFVLLFVSFLVGACGVTYQPTSHYDTRASTTSLIQTTPTFFEHSQKDFSKLSKNEAVKTWGVCAGSYRLMQAVGGAMGDRYMEQGNGAQMTISLIYLKDALDKHGGFRGKNPAKELALMKDLSTASSTGKMVMESETNTSLTRLKAAMESNSNDFLARMENTMSLCLDNSDISQQYIDMWRELAANGWFTF